MDINNVFNLIVVLLTFIGFAIGFINEEYRLLAWSISLIVITIIILFAIFKEYFTKIDKNSEEIIKLKKDLNMDKRLTILETKFDELKKK
ncbi:MAG: hypothetical protein WC584_04070 [Candidatus Pacearchaeota archaeon]